MDSEKLMIELVDTVLDQAKIYLRDYGGFFPFSFVYSNNQIIPFNVYSGNDRPSPTVHLSELKEALLLKHHTYAIGINSIYTHKKSLQKEDVVEIRLTLDDQDYDSSFVPYKLENGSFEFYDMFV